MFTRNHYPVLCCLLLTLVSFSAFSQNNYALLCGVAWAEDSDVLPVLGGDGQYHPLIYYCKDEFVLAFFTDGKNVSGWQTTAFQFDIYYAIKDLTQSNPQWSDWKLTEGQAGINWTYYDATITESACGATKGWGFISDPQNALTLFTGARNFYGLIAIDIVVYDPFDGVVEDPSGVIGVNTKLLDGLWGKAGCKTLGLAQISNAGKKHRHLGLEKKNPRFSQKVKPQQKGSVIAYSHKKYKYRKSSTVDTSISITQETLPHPIRAASRPRDRMELQRQIDKETWRTK